MSQTDRIMMTVGPEGVEVGFEKMDRLKKLVFAKVALVKKRDIASPQKSF